MEEYKIIFFENFKKKTNSVNRKSKRNLVVPGPAEPGAESLHGVLPRSLDFGSPVAAQLFLNGGHPDGGEFLEIRERQSQC